MNHEKTAAAVRDLLAALEVDAGEHTTDTPERVASYWEEALAGYTSDPAEHLTRTFDPPPGHSGPVIVSGLTVTSTCAHHLLPITGRATVAYRPRPGYPVVGLSKLSRVLEGFARRLQVQEQLGQQVVSALMQNLDPEGAACIITAEHGCMTVRGVAQHQAVTTTYAWGGQWDIHHAEGRAVLDEHRAGHTTV